MTKFSIKYESKRLFLILLGSVLFALNISFFVKTANLFPGGFSGIALLIQKSFLDFLGIKLPYSILVYSFNVIPVIIGFKFIGKKFTIYSVIMIIVSGFLTDIFSDFDKLRLTNDLILCSIFGGILNAIAISCCLFADSSSGGTDFIAIYVSEKTGKSAWNYILIVNCIILLIAGLLFGWDKALYSIIFQYTSTQALNLLYKRYSKTTLLIITDKESEIYEVIKSLTNHGATVFEGIGEYSKKNHKMLYTVVSSDESGKLEKEIRKIDPNAFINVLQSKEIIGKFFKRAND